ncbi:alpha-ketoglutarate-dependent dioxygenase AlkB [Mesorhizobium sp. M1338]|uniref:alpha-ketoglutarate-dependent dioxygenase AlkB n=1 Tax=unclassified Mesorhizobium TaxID=325217 RepID=UPI00333A6B23
MSLGQNPLGIIRFHGATTCHALIDIRGSAMRNSAIHATGSKPPIPDFLLSLRKKVAILASRPAEAFAQVLINEYQPGAGIGWHRDKPHFEDVAGVSLLAPCSFRLRRKNGTRWDRQTILVEPRSAYLMTGPSRTEWEHSIPPLAEHRYSITLRTLRSQNS